jgi:hypothetical protein
VAQEFANRAYSNQHIFIHSILKENTRKGIVQGFLKHDFPTHTHHHHHHHNNNNNNNNNAGTGQVSPDDLEFGERGEQGEEEEAPRDWYPFDPYLLPLSKGFVGGWYLEYDAGEEGEGESEEESDEEMDMEM